MKYPQFRFQRRPSHDSGRRHGKGNNYFYKVLQNHVRKYDIFWMKSLTADRQPAMAVIGKVVL